MFRIFLTIFIDLANKSAYFQIYEKETYFRLSLRILGWHFFYFPLMGKELNG
jgi:hypothetical protein